LNGLRPNFEYSPRKIANWASGLRLGSTTSSLWRIARVRVAKTSRAPVLLKKSDITEASDAERKPAELGKANLLFWQRFKRDRESTTRKMTLYFLWFTSNDAGPVVTISHISVNVFAKFFRQTAVYFTK